MRIAIFTNILNPYRSSFFDSLYESLKLGGDELLVFSMVEKKSDRTWTYSEFQKKYTRLLKGKTIFLRSIGYIHFNKGILHEILNFRPDVVIAAGSYFQPAVIELAVLKKIFNYKILFWSESHLNEIKNHNKIVLYLREILRYTSFKIMDGFLYPGVLARRFIEKYKSSNAILIQLPNTVDDKFFSENYRPKQIANSQKILFTPARLHPAKGILEFFEVIKEIDSKEYIWYIAGEGPLKDVIVQRIKDYKLNVKLLGNQSLFQVREFYRKSDFFVLPSKSDPNPLTCIEALWNGLPLLVSNKVGNSTEVVKTGVNGYVFDYIDKNNALSCLRKMLRNDDAWYSNARVISHKLAELNFKQSIVVENTINAIKMLNFR